MFECEDCTREFYSENALIQHMIALDHWPECETCTRTFRYQRACNQHMNDTNHWALTFPCQKCNLVYDSEPELEFHLTTFCHDCARSFQSDHNLRAHLNSRTHRGATVTCPFCKDNYTSASGLSHHLETGSCNRAPQLNREMILQILRERDPHGFITNKQITWHEGTRGTYSAPDRAWNGNAWDCYLCHRCFHNDHALNQHLNSPAHQQKVYHCPNRQCAKEFVSLAATFNHLESETCQFMRFENVNKAVGQVLSSNRMITFG